MKEIIKGGDTQKFNSHCEKCGCDFTFQVEDTYFEKLDVNYEHGLVKCPFCSREIYLSEDENKVVLVKR